MKRLTAALALLVMLVAAPAMAAPYVLAPGQTCDGWPRLPVATSGARYPAYGANGLVWKPYPGPAAEPLALTPGWQAVTGRRPMGAPVGLAVAADGAIWVADDRNGTVMRVSVDRP